MTTRRIVLALLGVALLACGERGAEPAAVVRANDVELRVSLDPALPRVGENRMTLELRDAAGAPIDDADVGVRVHMAAMGAMPAMGGPAAVRNLGRGRYAAEFALEMGGSWQVELRAQRPSGALAQADGSLTVGAPGLRLAGRGAAAATPPAEHLHHGETQTGAPEVAIGPGRLQAIGVRTVAVEDLPFESVLRAVGRVTWDESALRDVAPRATGFVRELYAATGARVERGAVLLTVYGPELYAAQLEYLQALASRDQTRAPGADALVRALRARLRLLDLADEDVRALERRGAPFEELPLRAPVAGVVVERAIVAGAAFAAGERLLRIAPDDRIWLEALVYASDLAHVAVGQTARVSLPALGDRVVEGHVSWISPDVSPDTRTARARIELDNRELRLQAGAWARVDLVRDRGLRLSVPESAVLYAGRRRFAFVEVGPGRFQPRAIEIGERSGERVEVRSGLVAGERVVASGTFLVAAESRLRAALESW
jgi:Cu(I)/Ag(I) efflux system membrane fusion protein